MDRRATRVVLEMSDRGKGVVVAVVTILAIGVAWAVLADPERVCRHGSDPDLMCAEAWPPITFVIGSIFVGVPCAVVAGWLVGTYVVQLHHGRVLAITTVAMALALLPTFAAIGEWPSHLPILRLAPTALFFSALAAFSLERWTRKPPQVPVAVVRSA